MAPARQAALKAAGTARNPTRKSRGATRCKLVNMAIEVAFELHVACYIGAPETELAGSPQDAAQGVRRADMDGARAICRPEAAAVPQLDTDRDLASEEACDERGEGMSGALAPLRGDAHRSEGWGLGLARSTCPRNRRLLGNHWTPPLIPAPLLNGALTQWPASSSDKTDLS